MGAFALLVPAQLVEEANAANAVEDRVVGHQIDGMVIDEDPERQPLGPQLGGKRVRLARVVIVALALLQEKCRDLMTRATPALDPSTS